MPMPSNICLYIYIFINAYAYTHTLFRDFQRRNLERQNRFLFRQIRDVLSKMRFFFIKTTIFLMEILFFCRFLDVLIDSRIYKQMRQHPFYGFPMQEFGRPQFSTVFKSQICYCLSKIHFLMDFQCSKFGRPQLVFKSQIRYFLSHLHFCYGFPVQEIWNTSIQYGF